MKRRNFLRASVLGSFAIATNLQANQLLIENTAKQKLIMPDTPQIKRITLDSSDEDAWIGWLARLAVSSLVTALGAKIVERYTDGCVCDETSCRKSPSDYSNAIGIYGYSGTSKRFVRQTVNDSRVSFDNVSVPFLDNRNRRIGNVEGPFLAGLCWAADSITTDYKHETVKEVLLPTHMTQNGGYRFDTAACYPTKYKTDHGSTEIQYAQKAGDGGIVTVRAYDKYDKLNWQESYDFDYA